MKMTLKTGQAVQCLNALKALERRTDAVPAKVGYCIFQNMQALETALVPYHRAMDAVIKRHAKNGVSVNQAEDPEGFAACLEESAALNEIEVEIDIKKFPFSLIERAEWPVNVILALGFMIGE